MRPLRARSPRGQVHAVRPGSEQTYCGFPIGPGWQVAAQLTRFGTCGRCRQWFDVRNARIPTGTPSP